MYLVAYCCFFSFLFRVVRAGMDGFMSNVCPCNVQYRYLLVVYEYHTWKQVYMKSNIAPRFLFMYSYIFMYIAILIHFINIFS